MAERYAQSAGARLDDVAFYWAFAHFKFAIIAQGFGVWVAAGAMAVQDFGHLDDEVLGNRRRRLVKLEQEG